MDRQYVRMRLTAEIERRALVLAMNTLHAVEGGAWFSQKTEHAKYIVRAHSLRGRLCKKRS